MVNPKDGIARIDKAYLEQVAELEDPDEAIAKAIQLLDQEKDAETVISRIKSGRKRHPGFGLRKVRPLDGVSLTVSSKIRQIVGLRYSGFSDPMIERALGFYKGYIFDTELRVPKAFTQAREELLKNAVTEFNQNVAFSRAALSECAFKAVQTLVEQMDNPDSKPAEKIRAAETVLKLTVSAAQPSAGEMAGEIIRSFGDSIAKISKASKGPSYIMDDAGEEYVDAEEVDLAPVA